MDVANAGLSVVLFGSPMVFYGELGWETPTW